MATPSTTYSRHFSLLVVVLFVGLLSPSWAYVPHKQLPPCTKQPPGEGYTCGKQGGTKYKSTISLTNVTTLDACRIECLQGQNDPFSDQTPSCGSITYNAKAGTCSLFIASGEGFRPNASSPTVYYDFACFDCLYTNSPPPPGTNLLVNPGFEAPISSRDPVTPWVPSFENVIHGTDSPGYKSAHDFYFQDEYINIGQTIPLVENVLYDISFKYKIRYANNLPHSVQIDAGDSNWELNQIVSAATNNTWQTFQGTFQYYKRPVQMGQRLGDQVDDIRIRLENVARPFSRFWLDNIVVTPSASQTFPSNPSAINLVRNGGWETGNLKPWNVTVSHNYSTKNLTFISPGENGTKYALVFDPSRSKGGSAGSVSFALNQTINLEPEASYIVSFALKFGRTAAACRNPPPSDNYDINYYVSDLRGVYPNLTGTRQYIRITSAISKVPNAQGQYVIESRPIYSFSSLPLGEFMFGFEIFGYSRTNCALILDSIEITKRV